MSDNLKTVPIPTLSGQEIIEIKSARPLFFVGGNGTGKSALLNFIVRHRGQGTIFITGTRAIYFDNESLNITAAGRKSMDQQIDSWNQHERIRWNPIGGTNRNEKAIYDLQALEIEYKTRACRQLANFGVIGPVS